MAIQFLRTAWLPCSLVLLAGCEKWADGVVREVYFPPHQSELAATVLLTQGDMKAVAALYQSSSAFEQETSTIPSGVTARIEHNGNVLLEWLAGDTALLETGWDNRYVHAMVLDEPLDLPEGEIQLIVEAPGRETLTATATQPPIPVADVTMELGVDTVEGWDYYESYKIVDRIGFDLHNRASIRDIHAVQFLEGYVEDFGDTSWYEMNVQRDEPSLDPRMVFNGPCNCFLIDDRGLDGESLSGFELDRYRYFSPDWPVEVEDVPLRMVVRLLDPALADFYRSVETHSNASNNPFASPSTVYSNTSTGYGCFGLASKVELRLN